MAHVVIHRTSALVLPDVDYITKSYYTHLLEKPVENDADSWLLLNGIYEKFAIYITEIIQRKHHRIYNFNISTVYTDRQTDRRTDGQTTCHGNTALCVSSHGKTLSTVVLQAGRRLDLSA